MQQLLLHFFYMPVGNQGDLKGFRSPLPKTIWLWAPLPGQLSSLVLTISTCTHRAVVVFRKVIRPLNAIGVPRGPKAQVGGEHERGEFPPSRKFVMGIRGISPRKFLNLRCL